MSLYFKSLFLSTETNRGIGDYDVTKTEKSTLLVIPLQIILALSKIFDTH